jgi:PadR family transcriptional regulator PadR
MNQQFKKGVLELCVLSQLKKGDKYGYELSDVISKIIDIAEGTLYPLLIRLRKEGYFDTYIVDASGGPPRKYYRLTQKGIDTEKWLRAEWKEFVGQVAQLIGDDEE